MIGTSNQKVTGKRQVAIDNELFDVYPDRCPDHLWCVQCWLNGKLKCDPRFERPKPEWIEKHPKSYHKIGWDISLDKIITDSNSSNPTNPILLDILVAQPLIPIPDGGFTSHITEQVANCHHRVTRYPWRVTDAKCDKCGYPYLRQTENRTLPKNGHSFDGYLCPNCGHKQSKDCKSDIWGHVPVEVKKYIVELYRQGMARTAIIRKVLEVFNRPIGDCTLYKAVREANLKIAPSKKGVLKEHETNIYRAYLSGVTKYKLAKTYDVSQAAISRCIKKVERGQHEKAIRSSSQSPREENQRQQGQV